MFVCGTETEIGAYSFIMQDALKEETGNVEAAEANADAGAPNWNVQDPTLKQMWETGDPPQKIAEALGRSVAAVMTRAARLGLPRRFAPGRKPLPKDGSDMRSAIRAKSAAASITRLERPTTLRVCLMCLEKFPSAGAHNRICTSCRDTPEYTAGSRLPDLDFPV